VALPLIITAIEHSLARDNPHLTDGYIISKPINGQVDYVIKHDYVMV